MVVNILALIVVLGILVFLHEGGHFLAARAVGARVSVFSIGFGRRLFGWKRGETDYRVSAIPLGGYVRIHGLGPDESDLVGASEANEEMLPRWKRAVILIAGPVANVLGAVLFVAIALMLGADVPAWQDGPARIGWVEEASPGARAGLRPDDLVVSVDGTKVESWRQFEMAVVGSPDHPVELGVRRETSEVSVTVTPEKKGPYGIGWTGVGPVLPVQVYEVLEGSPAQAAGLAKGDVVQTVDGERVRRLEDFMKLVGARAGREVTLELERSGAPLTLKATPRDEGGQGKLGVRVGLPTAFKRVSPLDAPAEAVRECWRMTGETFAVIGRMFTGRASLKQMSGPIDIARFSGEAARAGTVPLIWLLGVISLQLAIFNLLPIPVLDGGHLAVIGVESVRRRDLSFRTKERIMNVGFWLIIALVVVVLYNDILKTLPAGVSKLIPGWAK
ncbi:MAG: RIP metalloprotease RseP [Acidobacteriota bacterium]